MARKRVEITDEDINTALSQKAAKILGDAPQSEQVTPKRSSKPAIPKHLIIKLGVGLLALALILGISMLISDRNQLKSEINKLSSTSVSSEKDETQQLVDRLGKFMELPSNETPTLATVSDVESLKAQVFFKNAQNSDQVLLYAEAGKAILYRPSTQKIIEVATINTGATGTAQQQTTQP